MDFHTFAMQRPLHRGWICVGELYTESSAVPSDTYIWTGMMDGSEGLRAAAGEAVAIEWVERSPL